MFPSPYGVSFILIKVSVSHRLHNEKGFRLLTEYHSFLSEELAKLEKFKNMSFPSPYGVSFILIQTSPKWNKLSMGGFPSPYGVSFILIVRLIYNA